MNLKKEVMDFVRIMLVWLAFITAFIGGGLGLCYLSIPSNIRAISILVYVIVVFWFLESGQFDRILDKMIE